jgi:hypothetical protein
MNAVAEQREHQVVAQHPASDSASLLQIISRAASDPAVDIDKMERLLQMHERLVARDAEQEFNLAMTQAQREMRPVSADATNPQTHSKYATYAKLDAALRPIYTECGFSLSFDEGESPKDELIRVLCYVSHTGGFTRTYHKDMPADGKGAKGNDVMTKTHASGAAMSYGMRYLLKGIFNVAVGEDDRDGNAPPRPAALITVQQADEIRDLIRQAKSTPEKFCEVGKIEAIEDVRAADFASAKAMLLGRIKKIEAAAGKVDPKAQFDQMERGQ